MELLVFNELTILPAYVLNQRGISKAVDLLSAIDLKDIAYLALSMQLELVLLTRDKPLYRGLKKQGFRKVMLFEDFISNQ